MFMPTCSVTVAIEIDEAPSNRCVAIQGTVLSQLRPYAGSLIALATAFKVFDKLAIIRRRNHPRIPSIFADEHPAVAHPSA